MEFNTVSVTAPFSDCNHLCARNNNYEKNIYRENQVIGNLYVSFVKCCELVHCGLL
jgi:hypothetical protein